MVLMASKQASELVTFAQLTARVGRVSTVYGRTTFPPSRIQKIFAEFARKIKLPYKNPKTKSKNLYCLAQEPIPKTKMQIPKVKMKIENRAGKAHNILAWPIAKNNMREFTIVNMAFPQVTLNLLGV